MLLIGERINGMFKATREAIQKQDKAAIQDLARRQMEGGAHMLDVNVGPAAADRREEAEMMKWLVTTVQEAVNLPLSLDSTKAEVIEAGLKVHKGKAMINSTKAEPKMLEDYLSLTKEYGTMLVGLAIDEKGIPRDADGRAEVGARIVMAAMEKGIPVEDIYLDPIILPVNVTQETAPIVIESIKAFKLLSDPAPKTIIGLSNVSQKASNRLLINRTYMVMCTAAGLDAAILDTLDKDLIDAVITAELLMNKNIYCDSFLEAYRKSSVRAA
ncbi:MAG: dihydropteroate synthase [bacterium]